MSDYEAKAYQERAQQYGGVARGLNAGPPTIGGAAGAGAGVTNGSPLNVRPGVHDLMTVVEKSIADADKAAQALYEALSAAGVLRAGAGHDCKKARSNDPADAPMLGRLMEQQRQIDDLAWALHVLRESLAF